ncbi:LysR family transcriptional regulator [Neobacillus mesonae]|uniref:LysR family transcriptional regulator n=1 Tax=Neobacillus mesonae TaxID=1193713 RepID=UPI002040723D|nr:LysR family transcriptional regulator [Neobacillus mesonae]MCM3570280.1 LysR family transcriptional regulator [Neobacillus mesonae]
MDIRQLKYFKTIVDEGNITHAAEKLHMAQPPLSQQLKKLEQELKTTLIKRYKSEWELTETGITLYRHANQILSAMDYIEQEIRDIEDGVKGSLSIGISSSCAKYLPKIIYAYRKNYPNVFIHVYKGDSSYLENLLVNRKIELALMLLPSNLLPYEVKRLKPEPFTVVMPAKWYEKFNKTSITLKEANDFPILMLGSMEGFSLHENILNFFSEKQLVPNIVLECKDIFSILNFVSEEIGIAILPRSEVYEIFNNKIKTLPINDLVQFVQPSIVLLKNVQHSKAAHYFLNTIV